MSSIAVGKELNFSEKKRIFCIAGIVADEKLLNQLVTELGYDYIETNIVKPATFSPLCFIPLYFYICKISFISVSILQSFDSMHEFINNIKNVLEKNYLT